MKLAFNAAVHRREAIVNATVAFPTWYAKPVNLTQLRVLLGMRKTFILYCAWEPEPKKIPIVFSQEKKKVFIYPVPFSFLHYYVQLTLLIKRLVYAFPSFNSFSRSSPSPWAPNFRFYISLKISNTREKECDRKHLYTQQQNTPKYKIKTHK